MTNRNGRRLAYFYGRVSTEGQDQALSIGEQRKNASTIAGHEGFEIIRDFTEVRSAATDDRAVFQEMRSLAISPEHPVDAIFFNDLSRAFRDDEDFYINRRVFREAGVEIYTYEEGHLTEDDDSQLRFGFKSLVNSLVPRKTARETRRGQFGATNLGYYIGPDVFGYEKYKVVDEDATDTKKPVEHTKLRPHPTQWEHLLTMCRMALENRTPQRIADHLNALGVKTTKGKEWNEGSVLYVLRNPICRGKTHRGAHSKSRYLDRSQRARKENAHEAAMSDEDYETIEELIRLRTTYQGGPRVHSSPNPLSDHVICGICGWNMTLSRSKGITRLICSNKRKNKVKACPAENVRLDVLVPRVTAALLDRIITEQTLRQQVTLVAETNREFLEEKQAARVTIQKNIKGTQTQISRLIDTIENRGGNPQIYERLDKRENEIRQLEVRLDGLDETFQDQLEFLNNPERIIACALDLRTYIESEDPEIARTFILSFVKKVVVLKKQATIHYTIPVPRGRRGNAEPTDTVNLEKNVVREESCLLPQRAGKRRCGLFFHRPFLSGCGPPPGVAAPAGLPVVFCADRAAGLARDGWCGAVPAFAALLGLTALLLGKAPVVLHALRALVPGLFALPALQQLGLVRCRATAVDFPPVLIGLRRVVQFLLLERGFCVGFGRLFRLLRFPCWLLDYLRTRSGFGFLAPAYRLRQQDGLVKSVCF